MLANVPVIGWSIFVIIEHFCNLSQTTVEQQIRIFLATKFMSSQAINQQQFYAQIDRNIQTMIQASQRQTTIPIKLIRDTAYSNQVSTR